MRYGDLPVFNFARTSMKANSDGIYVYTGAAACAVTMTLGSGQTIGGVDTAGIRIFKNQGVGTVTITATIFDTASVASLALTTGQGAILVWDGAFWSVVGKA